MRDSRNRYVILRLAFVLGAAVASALSFADAPETALEPPPVGLIRPLGSKPSSFSPADSAPVEGFPDIGLWMINRKGFVADWIGIPAGGKKVAEPINVIMIDRVSTSAAIAVARLEKALASQGFPSRSGHSNGYSALIGRARCGELVYHSQGTFSDASFLNENDHGRIFGPYDTGSGFVFTAAFSRERLDPFGFRHLLVSFNVARDDVASALESSGLYRIAGMATLGNALLSSRLHTTWDHDGNAVVIEAVDAESTGLSPPIEAEPATTAPEPVG